MMVIIKSFLFLFEKISLLVIFFNKKKKYTKKAALDGHEQTHKRSKLCARTARRRLSRRGSTKKRHAASTHARLRVRERREECGQASLPPAKSH